MRYKNNRIMRDWVIFTTVVEEQSFSIAAKKLFCSVASISKSISRLEGILEEKLLTRNAHKVEVTATGQVAYKKAKEIQKIYHDLFSEVNNRDNLIKGRIRFSAPSILCEFEANKWVYEYMIKNEHTELHLLSRERTVLSLASPEFDDLVLKSGMLDSPDLIHQALSPMKFSICASPDYLEKHGEIKTPDDLQNHWIMKVDHPFLSYPIMMKNNEDTINLDIQSGTKLTSNNLSSVLRMTLSGAGICLALPDWVINKYVKEKKLVRILPEWELPVMQVYLVWRYRERYSTFFNDFRKFIERKWSELLQDEREG